MSGAATIECVKCEQLFTQEDIKYLRYFIESGLCFQCSYKLYKLPEDVACFGKLYSNTAKECKLLCPDRKVCPLFFTREVFELRRDAKKEAPKELAPNDKVHLFQPGSIIYKAFEMCRKGISIRKFEMFIQRSKANRTRLLRIFRKGELYGKKWTWKSTNGKYKITL